jgi:hypothetical protein
MADTNLSIGSTLARAIARGGAIELNAQGGVFALLNVPFGSIGCSFSSSTNQITLDAAQTWPTKTKVQFSASGFSPPSLSPLALGTNYWLIRISSTVFAVATSLANAAAGTATALPSIATGNYTVNVVEPSAADAVADLIAFEVSHPVYTARLPAPNAGALPAATASGGVAKQLVLDSSIFNSNAATLTFNAIAIVSGGNTAIGNTGGTIIQADVFKTFNGFTYSVAPIAIASNETQEVTYSITSNYA